MKAVTLEVLAIAMGIVGGCGAPVGTQPHDASAVNHEGAVQDAEARARTGQSGPTPFLDCLAASLAASSSVCWSEALHHERERQHASDFYRQLAARHRSAVAALRDVEATACAGLHADDRDVSPFFHRADILAVEPTRGDSGTNDGSAAPSQPVIGAAIVFRAVPGLTAERLQRLVDCHLARAAALGHDAPELGFCPLVPAGVKAEVFPTKGGFAVAITADNPSSADEVWRRAAALVIDGGQTRQR